jgi:excisionase family DNA binding protein
MVEKSHYVRRVTQTIQPNELSRHEAALYLGVSLRTLDRLREDGEIESFLVRGCVRVVVAAIDAYKERQREAARRERMRAGRPMAKSDFEIEIPFLAERRRQRAA